MPRFQGVPVESTPPRFRGIPEETADEIKQRFPAPQVEESALPQSDFDKALSRGFGVPDRQREAEGQQTRAANLERVRQENPYLARQLEEMSGTEQFLAGAGKRMVDMGQGVGQLLGLVDQEDIQERQRTDRPLMDTSAAANAGSVAGGAALTVPAAFIPGANAIRGATAIGAGLGLAEPVPEGNVASGKLQNAATGAAFGAAGNQIARGIGNKAKQVAANRSQKLASQQSANSVKDTTLKNAQKLGYKVNPTQANPTRTNQALEGAAGKISTAQKAAESNQQVTNAIARRSLGLPDDTPLSTDVIEGVRRQAGKAYEAVKGIGRPIASDKQYADDLSRIAKEDLELASELPEVANKSIEKFINSFKKDEISPSAAIETIKRLRNNAKTLLKSDNPARVAKGRASRQVADAVEGLVERNLKASGDDQLFKDFTDARQLIAKTYTVENALNPATGNVVSRKLANELGKGRPLSGEMKQAAEFASAFPRATQEITSSMPGISPLDAYGSIGMSAASGNPAFLATMLGRPAARSTILSGPYQRNMTQPSYSNDVQELIAAILGNQRVQALGSQSGNLANTE